MRKRTMFVLLVLCSTGCVSRDQGVSQNELRKRFREIEIPRGVPELSNSDFQEKKSDMITGEEFENYLLLWGLTPSRLPNEERLLLTRQLAKAAEKAGYKIVNTYCDSSSEQFTAINASRPDLRLSARGATSADKSGSYFEVRLTATTSSTPEVETSENCLSEYARSSVAVAPLRVEARLLSGGNVEAGTYSATCSLDGEESSFGPLEIPYEPTVELTKAAPVGATCIVTQDDPGGAVVIGRTSITDQISPSGLTVQFVNTVTRRSANFVLIATSNNPVDDRRRVFFNVACPTFTADIAVPINQSVAVEGSDTRRILEGDVCTVAYVGAGLADGENRTRTIRAVGTSSGSNVIASVEFEFDGAP